MSWTTPEQIHAQVARLWERGRILAAGLLAQPLFPWPARLTRPTVRELGERFGEARAWIRALEEGSKTVTGAGYEVLYDEVNHRQLGANRVPRAVVVPSEADALALIGKRRQAETFARLVERTRRGHPELLDWIARHPLDALGHADDWERVLAVVDWFQVHPRPGLYARQIDVPGVHTKFLEAHRGLLAELLDRSLPAPAVDTQALGAQGFELRYGLRSKPTLLRFRVLDRRCSLQGLDDVSTPIAQFATLELPIRRVFITENEINGLAFPEAEASLVVFGLGYGIERLALVPWLRDRAVFYWGDLDTHGFAILDRLRAVLPGTRSFLMDRATLLAHRALWGQEPERHEKDLVALTPEESEVYDDLRFDRLGDRVRLEQEHIGFAHVQRALVGLLAP